MAFFYKDGGLLWKELGQVEQKIKIFGWLLHLDRLNTRANLHKKTILDDAICHRCSHPVEDREHLFLTCFTARAVWTRIGIAPSFGQFTDLWTSPLPDGLPRDVWPSIALAICWKIWDARNAKVFRAIDQNASVIIGNIVSDLILWINRCKRPVQKEHADLWCTFLSSRRV